ncbi:cytoplasmic tyrosine-protein kinase BMX-like [Sceloporus undulatus]|uniref:cytoplasmic tyrosine-protein kinase BMX-like n=1 Tax=Sceloporus undulatus TaxID=8520 RepID=UPI001C4AC563|nr:cytoplasmic tyrosine-protein kinase BMX-like [Sceloporus undulatus]
MNSTGEKSILEEVLVKKSQQKKKISPNNYKERLFVLTKTSLSYYEYEKEKKGTRKGSIDVKNIRCAEAVDLEEQTLPGRQYPFQIVYKGGLLYIFSASEDSRRRWLEALHREMKDNTDLLNKYHSGFFSSGKFLCCNQTCKAAPGCTIWEKYSSLHSVSSAVKPLPPIPGQLWEVEKVENISHCTGSSSTPSPQKIAIETPSPWTKIVDGSQTGTNPETTALSTTAADDNKLKLGEIVYNCFGGNAAEYLYSIVDFILSGFYNKGDVPTR